MAARFDALLGKLRIKDNIPQVSSDPSSPGQTDAWILKTVSGGNNAGNPIGLLLALTYSGAVGGTNNYTLKYRTKEGTTIATTLS